MTQTSKGLTKSALVKVIGTKLDIEQNEARQVLDCLLEVLTEGLQSERKILISDFGSFQVSIRESFQGYNPHTGEAMLVPRRLLPVFKSGKALKQRLNPEVDPSKL